MILQRRRIDLENEKQVFSQEYKKLEEVKNQQDVTVSDLQFGNRRDQETIP